MKRRETITDEWIASRTGWTPYHGKQFRAGPWGLSCAAGR